MPSTALTAAPTQRRRWTWEQWQHSTVSQRLLSDKDRQRGYTVLWVAPPLRHAFLAVAQLLRLYDTLFHKSKRTLSPTQLARLVAWDEATQALIAALQEEETL